MSLKLKVCGMREVDNIRELEVLKPDFMGMIFYEKSPRDASGHTIEQDLASGIARVGVFVNPTLEEVLERAETYSLEYVQLHGDETTGLAKEIKDQGLGLIKVFRIEDKLPVDEMKPFVGIADYFLFDTKTKLFGGSGKKFDWDLLKGYPLDTPYLISGGIGYQDIERIKSLDLKGLFGIDINSQVEVSPGIKDIEKVKMVKELL